MTTSSATSPSRWLVLNNIRSSHNVGALMRSAAAFGVRELILGGITPCPPRQEIAATSLGALEVLTWRYQASLVEPLRQLREQGVRLIAVEQTDRAVPIASIDFSGPVALILGNEREGVEPDILALCDAHAVIPQAAGPIHSLNVSNAGAIALYEAYRGVCYDGAI